MIDLEKFKIKGRYSSVPAALWDEFVEELESILSELERKTERRVR